MAEPDDARDEHQDDGDEEIASTPFDNPFFLPVILIGFAIWFTYDGWFNPDMEWIKFNRVGALVTAVLGSGAGPSATTRSISAGVRVGKR